MGKPSNLLQCWTVKLLSWSCGPVWIGISVTWGEVSRVNSLLCLVPTPTKSMAARIRSLPRPTMDQRQRICLWKLQHNERRRTHRHSFRRRSESLGGNTFPYEEKALTARLVEAELQVSLPSALRGREGLARGKGRPWLAANGGGGWSQGEDRGHLEEGSLLRLQTQQGRPQTATGQPSDWILRVYFTLQKRWRLLLTSDYRHKVMLF